MANSSISGASNAGAPPMAPGSVLAELQPYGRLVVHEHRRSESSDPAVDGEAVALNVKAAAAKGNVSGRRAIMCEWVPGPGFDDKSVIELSVSVVSTATWSLDLSGVLESAGVETSATCGLQVEVLGTERSFSATRNLKDSPAGEVHTRENCQSTFVARDGDTITKGKTLTKRFVTSVRATAATGPAVEGLSYAVGVSFATAWSFSVAVTRALATAVA